MMSLETIVKREREEFLAANQVEKFDYIRLLMYVQYVIYKRGACYDIDVAYVKKTPNGKPPMRYVRTSLWKMRNAGLVKYEPGTKLHPVYKRKYLITEKGLSVIDNYMSLYSRKN